MRIDNRSNDQLRPIKFTRNFTRHAEGSVLVEYGDTKVICTASFIEGKPRFLREIPEGWLTAEYGMLPRATHDRVDREAVKGKQKGRTQEIQRLIGRTLRSAIDLSLVNHYTIAIDCDVIQADGGTRTAAISGASVALADAVRHAYQNKWIEKNPLKHLIAAVSVGIVKEEIAIDLNYEEDSMAETDMNIVMNEEGGLIEVQGTAEKKAFTQEQFDQMLSLARAGIMQIIAQQKIALGLAE